MSIGGNGVGEQLTGSDTQVIEQNQPSVACVFAGIAG